MLDYKVCQINYLDAIKNKPRCMPGECKTCGWFITLEKAQQVKAKRDAHLAELKRTKFTK